MGSICELVKDILPNNAAKIQAWSSVLALGFTGIMARYAYKALTTWKEQKKLDIITEGKSNMLICIDYFEKVTNFEELAFNGIQDDEKLAYSRRYRIFFIKDFMEHLSTDLIADIIQHYDLFKAENMNARQFIIYQSSKILTYSDNLGYIEEDLMQLQSFYSNLISNLNSFDFGVEMLKHELNQRSTENGMIKEIVKNLLSFKTDKVGELRKLSYNIFNNKKAII